MVGGGGGGVQQSHNPSDTSLHTKKNYKVFHYRLLESSFCLFFPRIKSDKPRVRRDFGRERTGGQALPSPGGPPGQGLAAAVERRGDSQTHLLSWCSERPKVRLSSLARVWEHKCATRDGAWPDSPAPPRPAQGKQTERPARSPLAESLSRSLYNNTDKCFFTAKPYQLFRGRLPTVHSCGFIEVLASRERGVVTVGWSWGKIRTRWRNTIGVGHCTSRYPNMHHTSHPISMQQSGNITYNVNKTSTHRATRNLMSCITGLIYFLVSGLSGRKRKL